MTGKRGRYAVGKQRIEQILDAAYQRFATDGYGSTSLASIARDAGLTEAGILHYFRSKPGLLIAVSRRRLATVESWWAGLPAEPDMFDILGRMLLSTRRLVADAELIEFSVLNAVETARLVHAEDPVGETDQARAVAAVAAGFAACQERGQLVESADPERLARQCIALSDGLHLQWIICRRGFDLAAVILDHLEFVARSTVPDALRPPDVRARLEQVAAAADRALPSG
ncbi:MAG: helix-turn-helix domain-containing protein [Nocardioides sp.]|uniref:TetR/AcrR family transcriptional regulator n=1 Tax=Nocardioides sp. TaxID=35761 RepID=UPI0039E4468D